MKRIFHTLALAAAIAGTLASCNNGDYVADPNSNANPGVNPVTPLTESEFTWENKNEKLAADINGTRWVADNVTFYLDSTGANVVTGYKDKSDIVVQLYMRDVWGGNLYDMEYKNMDQYGTVISTVPLESTILYSYLGNSGGLKITQNDSAWIRGSFYFKAIDAKNNVTSVLKGVMNIEKPL
ncbi:MAG: hypothetical protein KF744_13785 [Taibaiella sp.]|nr:hypothetical protein [Taibaiella sp.]